MLDQIKQTSFGPDNFPHWFLQLAVPSFSLSVSHLFNFFCGKLALLPLYPRSIHLWPVSITRPSPLLLFLPDLWKNQSSRTLPILSSCNLNTIVGFMITSHFSQLVPPLRQSFISFTH